METHLDGKIVDIHRRIKRTLLNIVAETGATKRAEVAAPGLAAHSAVWRVLLGSNFHSSHSPRPALRSPLWSRPLSPDGNLRRLVHCCSGEWRGRRGRQGEEEGKEEGKEEGAQLPRAPATPRRHHCGAARQPKRGTGEGEGGEQEARGPQAGETGGTRLRQGLDGRAGGGASSSSMTPSSPSLPTTNCCILSLPQVAWPQRFPPPSFHTYQSFRAHLLARGQLSNSAPSLAQGKKRDLGFP